MKLTAAYILRLLKSPALYIGISGCALIALWGIISAGNFTSAETFVQYIRFTGTAQLFSDMMDFGTYRKLILIAACMPFTAAFCTEFKSGLSKQIILRSSQKNYILTHAVLNFLCTFSCLSWGSFCACLRCRCFSRSSGACTMSIPIHSGGC